MTVEPLPEGTRLLHIGPQKTGSTALQAAMHQTRDELARHGVLYPGPGPRPREAAEVGLGFRRLDGRPKETDAAWQDLLRQVHDPSYQRVCVSLEAFGRASDEQIVRIVETLGGERPHVLAVARRYDSLMPSQWQQRVKSQMVLTYDEWLRIVLGEPDPDEQRWRNLWVPHDTVSLVERWTSVVGPENFTLVIGDERDRSLLPRTVEQLLGVPDGTLDVQVAKQNQSLTYSQVELLRRVNVVWDERGWSHNDYHELVRRGLVPQLLSADAPAPEPRIPPLPAWARARLVELSDARVEGIRGLPVRVVGDPEALRVSPEGGADDVAPPAEQVSVETAVRALEGMAAASARRRRTERRAHRRTLQAARRTSAAGEPRPADSLLGRAARRLRRR